MRLNKYIAHAGVASRRKADELIQAGKVKINGSVVKELGIVVQEGDVVQVNGVVVKPVSKLVYYMLNKPVGYITSLDDEKDRPVVNDLMEDIAERIYPVGRLDYMTSGLLLMTNDGDVAYGLTHPKHQIYKTYRVEVAGMFTHAKGRIMEKGVDIGGFVTSKSYVEIIRQHDHSSLVEIKIYEGKNRQVRKMFEATGHRVINLERIAIGDLRLGHLKQGHYRKLSPNEIDYLKRLIEH